MNGTITIIEIKEIDIYDIIILKASNTSDLTDWLLENNFKIPEESYSILKGYVDKENCYFVINKIDLKNRFKDVIDELENGTAPSEIPNYKNYSNAISDLRVGMSTPLKFKFTPLEPYYPLTISSFSKGYGSIHIYVVAECPVTDKNNILKLDDCKSINDKLKENLSLHFPVEKANYVSRFIYYDKLSKLSEDAVFINFPLINPEKPISIHSTDDFDFVIAEHHIWGICKNKIVIEIQYKFDDDVSWKVANGSYLWSIDLNPISFRDGEHKLYLRVLKWEYDQETDSYYTYSDPSTFVFLTLNGMVVDRIGPAEQSYSEIGLFLLSAMIIIGMASVAIISHKTKF